MLRHIWDVVSHCDVVSHSHVASHSGCCVTFGMLRHIRDVASHSGFCILFTMLRHIRDIQGAQPGNKEMCFSFKTTLFKHYNGLSKLWKC